VVFWYIFPFLGILCHEKSGNPGMKQETDLNSSELDLRLQQGDQNFRYCLPLAVLGKL
jgi:hypothetical protein